MEEQERIAELQRLWSGPVGVADETELIDPPVRLMDGPSFAAQYEEIFVREIYDFAPLCVPPTIVDGGANIGAAVIWWRSKWPDAHIVAFEPDPSIFEVLQWNTRFHEGLELRQEALATSDLGADFVMEGTDAGSLRTDENKVGRSRRVATERLSKVLIDCGHVDLLKLDIEGAESDVLREAETELSRADRIFFEYHSYADGAQDLGDLLSMMTRLGYRYYLESASHPVRPFLRAITGSMDLQCNVFATKER